MGTNWSINYCECSLWAMKEREYISSCEITSQDSPFLLASSWIRRLTLDLMMDSLSEREMRMGSFYLPCKPAANYYILLRMDGWSWRVGVASACRNCSRGISPFS